MRDADGYEVAMCPIKKPKLPDNHPSSQNIKKKLEAEVSLSTWPSLRPVFDSGSCSIAAPCKKCQIKKNPTNQSVSTSLKNVANVQLAYKLFSLRSFFCNLKFLHNLVISNHQNQESA